MCSCPGERADASEVRRRRVDTDAPAPGSTGVLASVLTLTARQGVLDCGPGAMFLFKKMTSLEICPSCLSHVWSLVPEEMPLLGPKYQSSSLPFHLLIHIESQHPRGCGVQSMTVI